jgi:hypothetical protein
MRSAAPSIVAVNAHGPATGCATEAPVSAIRTGVPRIVPLPLARKPFASDAKATRALRCRLSSR